MPITVRNIGPSDNVALASIIRSSLEKYGLNIPGTVYTDPTTDALYQLFCTPGSIYFVAEENGKILGGCGIFPTKGLPCGYAELVKLYLREEVRGKGLGRMLMEKCIAWSGQSNYTHLYLETFAELSSAVGLYKSLGFKDLPGPMGESGHHACQIWMEKKLDKINVIDFDIQSPDYIKSLFVRKEVFISEQKIDLKLELEYESDCRYFLVTIKDRPVSTGRLRVVGDKIKFERIATLNEYRGKGMGNILMRAMTNFAIQNYPDKIPYMHAQLSAVDFYLKCGWVKKGDIFHEADIPHVAMTLPMK